MPSIRYFSLKNFKGINNIKISIDEKNSCPVKTLIGLNESGKTTILEEYLTLYR
ncbi:AAA family ATPase [Ancylobacter sp. 3268]|uniref:AAA family ATPase n=1 Tax=Ancylobacter sp. 3268 TaxID=2817752 RepID=UPI00385775D6